MLLARRPTWVRPPAVRGNGTGASASGAASQASPAPPCPASFWEAGVRSAGDGNILVRLPEFDICEAQITSQLAPFAMTPAEITALLLWCALPSDVTTLSDYTQLWPLSSRCNKCTVGLAASTQRVGLQTPRDRRSHKESPRGSLLGGIPAWQATRPPPRPGPRPAGSRLA